MAIKNANTIAYTGVFFDRESLYPLVAEKIGKQRLQQNIAYPHVTFRYMPQINCDEFFGEKVEFRIVGYGNNGLNEGLCIEWVSGPPELRQLFDEIIKPHITLSVSANSGAVKTRYLDFRPIEPFNITGVFGGYSKNIKHILPLRVLERSY